MPPHGCPPCRKTCFNSCSNLFLSQLQHFTGGNVSFWYSLPFLLPFLLPIHPDKTKEKILLQLISCSKCAKLLCTLVKLSDLRTHSYDIDGLDMNISWDMHCPNMLHRQTVWEQVEVLPINLNLQENNLNDIGSVEEKQTYIISVLGI